MKGLLLGFRKLYVCVMFLLFSQLAMAMTDEDLAKQLTNPVANLTTLPFQGNYDHRINVDDMGHETYINVQPVVPFPLNSNWLLISRTILPLIDQVNTIPHSGNQTGLGDTLQSFFFSPISGDIIWGIGPAIQIPTATDQLLGTGKWAIGPTPVILTITGPWTIGILAHQIWSFSGSAGRPAVSQGYLQPFLAYTTKTAWTYTLNSESTYNWKTNQWSIPLNAFISKLTRIGSQPISIAGGIRYWAETPETGQKDFGLRLTITFLFPK